MTLFYSKTLFLEPTVTTNYDTGTTVRSLQRNVISQNPSFSWLLSMCDGNGTASQSTSGPFLVLAEHGAILTYTHTTADRLLESNSMRGTVYDWITPVIDYDWHNPERTRRFVSYNN